MAIKQKKTETFESIAVSFEDEMTALIDDFYQISDIKIENIDKILKKRKDKDDGKFSYENYINFKDENIKHVHFRFAMFNYLNSLFEKHINELLRFSIKNNTKVREQFLIKFIDLDKKQVEKNLPSLRDMQYEKMSLSKKTEFQMNYFKDISNSLPPLNNWEYFFNIPESRMWANKNLKFDYTEMRARRNLLTHRGSFYDQDYIDNIITTVKKSKKTLDPTKRFMDYHEMGFFLSSDYELKTLEDLVNKIKPKFVTISVPYFTHCFNTLIKIYFTAYNHATMSDTFAINIVHKLLVLSRRLKNPMFYFEARSLAYDFLKNYSSKNDGNDYLKANYLLAIREINKFRKKRNLDIKKTEFEIEFIEYFNSKHEPLYQLLIHLMDDNFDQCLIDIKNVTGLTERSKNWFIFSDLIDYKNFKEVLDKNIVY